MLFRSPLLAAVCCLGDNYPSLYNPVLCEAKHFNTRTRHLSLRYHQVGDQQRLGTIKLEYLPTNNMTADVLTKPLYRQAHNRHTSVLLGHKPLQWDGIATN